MVESVGKKLAAAREAKGLSLDEAAHATKIRPDKLAALEQDDFSSFANNTYARGFLQIYGHYLEVEVGELARTLQSGNPLSSHDYQYLNAVPDKDVKIRARAHSHEPNSRRPSLIPLIVFLVLLIGAGFAIHLFLDAQRLSKLGQKAGAETEAAATPVPKTAPVPEEKTPERPAAAVTLPAATPAPAPAPLGSQRIFSDRDFINQTSPLAQGLAAPEASDNAVLPLSELAIEPAKKSWVRIRRNDPA
ncbi:MAG: helix-turn-helix domain-containing protein, partial [Chthoniobacteraceae bacterium]